MQSITIRLYVVLIPVRLFTSEIRPAIHSSVINTWQNAGSNPNLPSHVSKAPGIEPGCGIYYNTDLTGDFFPDEYCVTYCNESYITPSGESLGQRVEIEECFSSEASLLQRFHDLGYSADSYQQLKLLTEDYEIWIHQFENPYN